MDKPAAAPLATLLTIVAIFAGTAFAGTITSPPPVTSATASAPEMSKDEAVDTARKAHPGEVTRVYLDSKMGRKTWAVLINGRDGKKWIVHYEVATGAMVAQDGK